MANDINRHSSLKNRDWQIACNEIKNKLQGEKNFFKPQFLVFAQSVVASHSCTAYLLASLARCFKSLC